VRAEQQGFTIVETVVAAAILLATCVGVSSVLSSALKADASVGRRDRLEEVLAAECQRLAALPYFEQGAGAGVAGGDPARDCLVADVFPWARSDWNTEDAFYLGASSNDPAGTFVTTRRVGEVAVRRRAVFRADERDESVGLGPGQLYGWDCAMSARPPATTLAIEVEATTGGRTASRTLLLTALRPSVEPSAPPSGKAA